MDAGTGLHLRNSVAHNNIGYALYQKGDVKDAISHYKQALEIIRIMRKPITIWESFFSRWESWTTPSQNTNRP